MTLTRDAKYGSLYPLSTIPIYTVLDGPIIVALACSLLLMKLHSDNYRVINIATNLSFDGASRRKDVST